MTYWKQIVTAVSVILFLACPGQARAQDLEIHWKSGPAVLNREVFKPWAEELEKKSNGSLTIQFFMPGAIAKTQEVVPALIRGTLDAGTGTVTSHASLMPRLQATNLYHVARDGEHVSELF